MITHRNMKSVEKIVRSRNIPFKVLTIKLHSKLNMLGFEVMEHGFSKDHVKQITYIKDRNIGWI